MHDFLTSTDSAVFLRGARAFTLQHPPVQQVEDVTRIMLAGNWKTARMVAHYSAGATAERGAVRKYL